VWSAVKTVGRSHSLRTVLVNGKSWRTMRPERPACWVECMMNAGSSVNRTCTLTRTPVNKPTCRHITHSAASREYHDDVTSHTWLQASLVAVWDWCLYTCRRRRSLSSPVTSRSAHVGSGVYIGRLTETSGFRYSLYSSLSVCTGSLRTKGSRRLKTDVEWILSLLPVTLPTLGPF